MRRELWISLIQLLVRAELRHIRSGVVEDYKGLIR